MIRTHKFRVIPRVVLGLMFVAGPLATAFHLAPEPALPAPAADFMSALARTGYMLPLLWSTEIAAGLMLLSGLMVPLGLVLLAPIIVNIAAFHVFLAPAALPPAIMACVLETVLAWQHRRSFAALFQFAGAAPREQARNLSANVAVNQ